MMNVFQSQKRALRKLVGAGLGLLLLAAAVVFTLKDADFSPLTQTPPYLAVLLLLSSTMSFFLTGLFFHVVSKSFCPDPPVGFWTMQQLIALGTVLNYIPVVRLGMWSRALYLRMYHRLPIASSLLATLVVLAVSVVSYVVIVLPLAFGSSPHLLGIAALSLLLLSLVTAPGMKMLLRFAAKFRAVHHAPPSRLTLAWTYVPINLADLLNNSLRLYLAFYVLGQPIPFTTIIIATCASLIVRIAGLTPNGLGLSEWVVAGLATAISPVSAATGAAAALIDRASDVLVSIPLALISAYKLRHVLHAKAHQKTAADKTS